MQKNTPNKFLAPIVIAGITIGFLASAYNFIFAMKKRTETEPIERDEINIEKEHEKSV